MLPPKFGTLLEQFVPDWQSSVAVNLKGGTRRAAESHLRVHIIPKLGSQRKQLFKQTLLAGLRPCWQSTLR